MTREQYLPLLLAIPSLALTAVLPLLWSAATLPMFGAVFLVLVVLGWCFAVGAGIALVVANRERRE